MGRWSIAWIFLMSLTVVGLLGGCSSWFGGDVQWGDFRTGEKIIGFVDDSLAIVSDRRDWYQDLGGFVTDHGERSGAGHQRLQIVNYRVQEDDPRWSDSLNNLDDGDFDYVRGQLTDSIIWGGNPNTKLSLWKIGEKPHKLNIKKKYEGCSSELSINAIHEWLDQKFIALGEKSLSAIGDTCQYAVLDTNERTITYKRLETILGWIAKCDDVRAFGRSVYCLKFDRNKRTSSLFVDDSLMHELENSYYWTAGAVVQFLGNMVLLERDVCRLESHKMKCFASASSNGIQFKNQDEDELISY